MCSILGNTLHTHVRQQHKSSTSIILIDSLTLDSIVDQCSTCIPNMVLFTEPSATSSLTSQSHIRMLQADSTLYCRPFLYMQLDNVACSNHHLLRTCIRHSTTQPYTYRPSKPLSLQCPPRHLTDALELFDVNGHNLALVTT